MPEIKSHPVNVNLTEKMLQNYKEIKVYGIDKTMPSHIVTLNSSGYEVYHQFLEKKGYEIVKTYLHSSKLHFDESPEMYFNIYRLKSLKTL